MPDKKISELTSVTTPLAGTEVLPIVQSSSTKKVTVANVTAGRDVSAKSVTGESNGSGSPSEFIARNTAGSERIHLLSRSEAGVSYVQVQNAQAIIGTLDNFNAQIRTNNAQRMLFDTSGNVTVTNGNLVIGTADKGIDFSANTNAAGMTSELLNDYEEGTFTPVFTNLTINSGTPTPTGIYTKIGRLVYVTVTITGGFTTATANSTYCTMPFITSGDHVCAATNSGSTADYGNGLVQSNKIFVPSWANQTGVVIASTFIV